MNTQEAKGLLEALPPAPWSIRKVILNSPQLSGALDHDAVCKIAEQAPATLAAAITLAEAMVPHDCWGDCPYCKALAEWEGLFPAEEKEGAKDAGARQEA